VLVTRNGTAAQNADYTITPFSLNTHPNIYQVTIPANLASQTVTLTPILDADETEGDETAEFTLIGDSKSYVTGDDTGAIITIADFTDLVFKDGFETP